MKDSYSFFAMMARMKYIERWALMRNSWKENISEHSLEVAMLSHALAILAKEKCGRDVDEKKVALMGLYHDANEVVTGDLPTPVKYYDEDIKEAYKKVERIASVTMLNKLPSYMKKYYEPLFLPESADDYEWKLVKAADKLSALIKCREERRAGNEEFRSACETTEKFLKDMQMEEVELFMKEFLPAYELTLDELQEGTK